MVILDESSRYKTSKLVRKSKATNLEGAYHSHFGFDTFGCDVHLESVNLRVLRKPKVNNLYNHLE